MFPFRFVAILLVVLACSGGGAAEVQRGSPIGFGDYITEGLPPDATNLIEIAASQVFTLGLRADGSVIGWGSSYNFGALSIPLDLPKVRQIAAGYYFGMALTEEGNVRVWGAWGHVFQTAIVTPPVEATNLVAIAGGMAHCFALRADGRVFAWGDHLSDALLVPAGLSNATSITAGQRFSLGITSAGQIVAWGNTEYYQQSAKPPGFNAPIASAISPFGFVLGLNSDGRLYGWGNNSANQLSFPVRSGITAIAAGSQHGAAITTAGDLVAWGDNTYLQGRTPEGFPKVFRVATGDRHTVALTRAPLVYRVPSNPLAVAAGRDLPIDVRVLASDPWVGRWYFNGVLLPGEISNTLFLKNAQETTAGKYTLTASNEFGMTQSSEIEILVDPSPLDWLLQPMSTAVLPGMTAEFGARARGTEPITYQWFHDGAAIPDSNTNRLFLGSATV